MERTQRYARCEQPKRSSTLSKTEANARQSAKVEETRKPESRMMRQVSRPVRRGARRKGRKDLARSLPYYHKAWAADQHAQRAARRATRDAGEPAEVDLWC